MLLLIGAPKKNFPPAKFLDTFPFTQLRLEKHGAPGGLPSSP